MFDYSFTNYVVLRSSPDAVNSSMLEILPQHQRNLSETQGTGQLSISPVARNHIIHKLLCLTIFNVLKDLPKAKSPIKITHNERQALHSWVLT